MLLLVHIFFICGIFTRLHLYSVKYNTELRAGDSEKVSRDGLYRFVLTYRINYLCIYVCIYVHHILP